MDTITLAKEKNGAELLELLRAAGNYLGFGLHKLSDNPEAYTYRAERYYPDKGSPYAFDTQPTLAIQFASIRPDVLYRNVACQAMLGTLILMNVDIDQEPEFKPDYDAYISKVKELSEK